MAINPFIYFIPAPGKAFLPCSATPPSPNESLRVNTEVRLKEADNLGVHINSALFYLRELSLWQFPRGKLKEGSVYPIRLRGEKEMWVYADEIVVDAMGMLLESSR